MKTYRLGGWEVVVGAIHELPFNVVLLDQHHGNTIATVDSWTAKRSRADGVTITPNVAAGIQTADCLPLVLTTTRSALLLHVSRHTLQRGLLDKVPQHIALKKITGVFIGPHICRKHLAYETIGVDLKKFMTKFPAAARHKDGVVQISLRIAVFDYLRKWGIDSSVIQEDKRCTFKDETLYSYRRWRKQKQKPPLPRLITAVHKV